MIDFEKIKKLNEEKAELLAKKPELKDLQSKIDDALQKCGKDKYNRMATISNMMLNSVLELNKKLQELKKLSNQAKTVADRALKE